MQKVVHKTNESAAPRLFRLLTSLLHISIFLKFTLTWLTYRFYFVAFCFFELLFFKLIFFLSFVQIFDRRNQDKIKCNQRNIKINHGCDERWLLQQTYDVKSLLVLSPQKTHFNQRKFSKPESTQNWSKQKYPDYFPARAFSQ